MEAPWRSIHPDVAFGCRSMPFHDMGMLSRSPWPWGPLEREAIPAWKAMEIHCSMEDASLGTPWWRFPPPITAAFGYQRMQERIHK